MRHPEAVQLALFAGGDLGRVERWRVAYHVRTCPTCRKEVDALRFRRDRLRDIADDMPESVNWNRLAQEMTANIHVGLAAGECVGAAHSRPRFAGWTIAPAIAAAMVVMIAALWLNLPREQSQHLVAALKSIRWERMGHVLRTMNPQDAVVLEATPAGIELKANGGAMTFLNSRSPSDCTAQSRGCNVAVSVSMQGSVGTRFVDTDTGQVTINKVYYAQ